MRRRGAWNPLLPRRRSCGRKSPSVSSTDNDGEPYTAFELAYKDAQGDEYGMDLLYYEHFNGGREYLIIAFSDDLMISFVRAG